ncbi:something about silencing, SAS, complex subunit 4-domain-containing protein, partial [Scheffersomyces amazonensis]|uniref:something about silencing, SAS, complex subunit 4-domain-containing protein n=1 Tax=Scheffersomyces amazonensis TaxID=1078765 RepID=UPI00315CED52
MTVQDSAESKRKLRSNDDSSRIANTALFNFDNINQILYRDKSITVTTELSFTNPYVYNGNIDINKKNSTTSKVSNVQVTHDLIPRRSSKLNDPLDPSIYDIFHKKMKRDERIMANEDRSRILSEVDNLQSQLQLLHQYDWIRYLPSICYINNPQDYDELEQKLALTITELDKLIRKHDNWRRRNDALNNEIKEFDTGLRHVVIEHDEYTADIATLRERRRVERRKRLGPTIRLKLHNGYTLIIDPIHPPTVL